MKPHGRDISRGPISHAFAWRAVVTMLVLLALIWGCAGRDVAVPRGIEQVRHVIVIYMENWSFDGQFGLFPGANGIANAGDTIRQVRKDGSPYTTLPQPLFQGRPDPRIPADLPVRPFNLMRYVPPDQITDNIVHLFYQQQYQINGGRMDKFVAWNDAGGDHGGLAMSHYDVTDMPLGQLARQYTLCDNFFHSAFGGSWLNHMWLISARTPYWPEAPRDMVAQLDVHGVLIPGTRQEAEVTPDGYAVNTMFATNPPYPEGVPAERRLPPQTAPTIGDRLRERGVSWAWYAGGWNDAMAGRPAKLFQFHHQPFAYFARYAPGTPERSHLKDEADFFRDLSTGSLPAVAFVKPIGDDNEHPGYATLAAGQQHIARLVKAIQDSSVWPHAVVLVTYDEHGGRWDHVPPPVIDRWGPGLRVPTVIISPFAKQGFVDHTQYETVSILKFIETRWGLPPLEERDRRANDLTGAFEF
ncbi:MAG: acid phosphatase [Candidatus Entotheonellia bacterium]